MAHGATMASEQKKAFKKKQKEEFVADLKTNVKKSPGGTSDARPEPTSLLRPIQLSLRNEHEKDEQTKMSGLIDTQYCTENKRLAFVLGTMVANTLSYGNTDKHALVVQFCIYFEKLG